MGSEEFLNRIVEALGVIVDRRPKGGHRKRKLNYMDNGVYTKWLILTG